MKTNDELQTYSKTVLEKGYGVVGKIVMQDRRLPIGAKCLYAYLCTFGSVAYPSREKICFDLQINKDTYTKHMKFLRAYGYVSVEQVREEGKFVRNRYTINSAPKPEKFGSAEITSESPAKNPCPKKSVPAASCPKKSDTEKSDIVPSDTIIPDNNKTTTNITSLNNINPQKTTTNNDLLVVGKSYGIAARVMQKFIAEYGRDAVEKELKLLQKSMARNPGKISNAGGWLHTALREGFMDSEVTLLDEKEAQRAETRRKVKEIEEQLSRQIAMDRALNPPVPLEENEFYQTYLKHKEKLRRDENRTATT